MSSLLYLTKSLLRCLNPTFFPLIRNINAFIDKILLHPALLWICDITLGPELAFWSSFHTLGTTLCLCAPSKNQGILHHVQLRSFEANSSWNRRQVIAGENRCERGGTNVYFVEIR